MCNCMQSVVDLTVRLLLFNFCQNNTHRSVFEKGFDENKYGASHPWTRGTPPVIERGVPPPPPSRGPAANS